MHHSRLRAFLPVALLAVLAAVVAAGATAAPSPRATLTGSTPSWATAANFKSAASASDPVGFRVYLGWRGDAAAAASSAVGTHKYLTPSQFRQQFAPTQADVNSVKNWLTSQGFTVDYTPLNSLYVAAEGTVAQAQAAFGVTFGEYRIDGLTLMSPSSDISVPASLAGTVQAVLGLDQSDALVHTDHIVADATPAPAFVNAGPCSTYYGQKIAKDAPPFAGSLQPYVTCGYTPAQLRGAYGLGDYTVGNDGSGQTVAIIDAYASPTIEKDVNTYSGAHGLPTLRANQFTQVVAPGTFKHPEHGNYQDPQGWYGEETLDIEAVHSMAPGANIVYVGAPNNFQDLDAALNHVVDRHLAQIVTNSYGWSTDLLPAGYETPVTNILIQAAAEGIGVYFSSGDNGDETTNGYRTADWPASSPWVTAVGGTSLGVGASNNYLFETYWGTDRYLLASSGKSWASQGEWWGGAGGGASRLFAEPWYQANAGIPYADYYGGANRVVPDVSMVADPNTGFLMGQTQTFPDGTSRYSEYRIGGTSLASPLFAGVMAVADQQAGSPRGFANPLFYRAAAGAFRDVAKSGSDPVGVVRVDYLNSVDGATRMSFRTFGDVETLHSVAGYDDATGLGTPNGQSFLNAVK